MEDKQTETRKNIAILPALHKGVVELSEKTGLKKVFIADSAIYEYLKKKGVDVEWKGVSGEN